MNRPDYWQDLTPRQRLNDAVHKYAQTTGTAYNAAWISFEERFNTLHDVNLSSLRLEHAQRYGIIPTIPSYLEGTGKIDDAVSIALAMTEG